LRAARAKGIYSRLEQADLLDFMRGEAPASYDLITAADVFIYVGKVDSVIAELQRLLVDGGLFAFSIEDLAAQRSAAGGSAPAPGYALTPTGRFAHAPGYLEALAKANGLRVVQAEPTQIRIEKKVPVAGWLALWKKEGPA
jgi:predicted TPR repeat methyltransferase